MTNNYSELRDDVEDEEPTQEDLLQVEVGRDLNTFRGDPSPEEYRKYAEDVLNASSIPTVSQIQESNKRS